ncbi:hypothetical protein PHLCEN_2v8762 [Hermanssonia centrifuga]|uniref:Uncharacterized protein n=1 Tax=Hermanssonia centrifuga TaxID=98765 RepID=A0A2R6NSP2_9APHY|nr:hypothetical protein PHLCEN_2v8762 [Hermanssonia centrifuga]
MLRNGNYWDSFRDMMVPHEEKCTDRKKGSSQQVWEKECVSVLVYVVPAKTQSKDVSDFYL